MLKPLQEYLQEKLYNMLLSSELAYGELSITVKRQSIIDSLLFLKKDARCQFIAFIDLSAVDFPGQENRFQLSYHLLSPKHNFRIRVKIFTDTEHPIDSITSIYAGAQWYEREVYDMYGVSFNDHPDLRRILTDYGFQGYPLRKDFPTSGYVECRYDTILKKVIYEPVALRQEMRNFDFLSPWVGMQEAAFAEYKEDKVE